MTTPLEREILTHYWTTPGPFPRNTPLICEITGVFIDAGILLRDDNGEVRANCDAMEPYMDALAAVPLPVMRWVIPNR